jgi:galactokinase
VRDVRETVVGEAPWATRWFRAPGRVNLMGDHTDYYEGFVLPLAIELECVVASRPNGDGRVRARSLDEDGAVDIAADGSDDPRAVRPSWGRYVAGVVRSLAERGRGSDGLDAVVASSVPAGSGLSSSAALEVSLGLALCDAADLALDATQLALACQRAEQRAVGVPSGILDQAASLLGREGSALLLDCGSLEHRWIDLPEQLAIIVVDSGERHAHEGSGYGDRRRELEAGDPRRVRHVTTENQRVRETVEALDREDLPALGALFAASHASLRDDYEVSTPTLDGVVEAALAAGALGARMTGGGFGGSVVVLAERARADGVLRGTLAQAGAQGWMVRPIGGATRRRTDSHRGRA